MTDINPAPDGRPKDRFSRNSGSFEKFTARHYPEFFEHDADGPYGIQQPGPFTVGQQFPLDLNAVPEKDTVMVMHYNNRSGMIRVFLQVKLKLFLVALIILIFVLTQTNVAEMTATILKTLNAAH